MAAIPGLSQLPPLDDSIQACLLELGFGGHYAQQNFRRSHDTLLFELQHYRLSFLRGSLSARKTAKGCAESFFDLHAKSFWSETDEQAEWPKWNTHKFEIIDHLKKLIAWLRESDPPSSILPSTHEIYSESDEDYIEPGPSSSSVPSNSQQGEGQPPEGTRAPPTKADCIQHIKLLKKQSLSKKKFFAWLHSASTPCPRNLLHRFLVECYANNIYSKSTARAERKAQLPELILIKVIEDLGIPPLTHEEKEQYIKKYENITSNLPQRCNQFLEHSSPPPSIGRPSHQKDGSKRPGGKWRMHPEFKKHWDRRFEIWGQPYPPMVGIDLEQNTLPKRQNSLDDNQRPKKKPAFCLTEPLIDLDELSEQIAADTSICQPSEGGITGEQSADMKTAKPSPADKAGSHGVSTPPPSATQRDQVITASPNTPGLNRDVDATATPEAYTSPYKSKAGSASIPKDQLYTRTEAASLQDKRASSHVTHESEKQDRLILNSADEQLQRPAQTDLSKPSLYSDETAVERNNPSSLTMENPSPISVATITTSSMVFPNEVTIPDSGATERQDLPANQTSTRTLFPATVRREDIRIEFRRRQVIRNINVASPKATPSQHILPMSVPAFFDWYDHAVQMKAGGSLRVTFPLADREVYVKRHDKSLDVLRNSVVEEYSRTLEVLQKIERGCYPDPFIVVVESVEEWGF